MAFTTLVSTVELQHLLGDPNTVIVDARFELTDPAAGQRAYLEAHIPGAVYAHLDQDLSGPVSDATGRHPLPELDLFRKKLGEWGIHTGRQVVVYDHADGAFASRLWWMLRYLNHAQVAVLDGGWSAWQRAGFSVVSGTDWNAPAVFDGSPNDAWTVSLEDVEAHLGDPGWPLIDSRDPRRYRGEHEPIDRSAGHIPHAVNHFYTDNLDPDGLMRPPQELRQQLESLLGGGPPQQAVFYCGSGVSACQNLLAMEHARLPGAKLFVGSWSQWCKDPKRPIATGTGLNP